MLYPYKPYLECLEVRLEEYQGQEVDAQLRVVKVTTDKYLSLIPVNVKLYSLFTEEEKTGSVEQQDLYSNVITQSKQWRGWGNRFPRML